MSLKNVIKEKRNESFKDVMKEINDPIKIFESPSAFDYSQSPKIVFGFFGGYFLAQKLGNNEYYQMYSNSGNKIGDLMNLGPSNQIDTLAITTKSSICILRKNCNLLLMQPDGKPIQKFENSLQNFVRCASVSISALVYVNSKNLIFLFDYEKADVTKIIQIEEKINMKFVFHAY